MFCEYFSNGSYQKNEWKKTPKHWVGGGGREGMGWRVNQNNPLTLPRSWLEEA